MLHFHATQKLLNTSRIKPVLYFSEPAINQLLHNWYVTLCGTGFSGKMLLLYVHEPSLLTVLVKGKTIASTINQFRTQLSHLLQRHSFPNYFIEKELLLATDYIVGKTYNKSMLAHINQMILQVSTYNLRYTNYDEIDTALHEDIFMDWHYKGKDKKDYCTPLKYWMSEINEQP